MLRPIVCCWCKNPSVNQYGLSPFNQMTQSQRFKSVFIHESCSVELTKGLIEDFNLNPSSPIVSEFYSGWSHAEFS